MANDFEVEEMSSMRRYRPSCVSLYCGAGGLDLGFDRAGYDIKWANDFDRDSVATYQHLFPSHNIIFGDIISERVQASLREVGEVDVVIGGPPCQGFSVGGKMDPDDPRSRHIWNFMDVIDSVRPKAFVMENVKALAKHTRWADTVASLKTFTESLGYFSTVLILNAADFGVPQFRERMFLIGQRYSDEIKLDPPTLGAPPTLRSVLEALPPFQTPGNDSKCTAKVTLAKNPVMRKSPFAGMLFNGQGRPLKLDGPGLTLPASMGGNRTPIIDQEEFETNCEPWVIGYHRDLLEGAEPSNQNCPPRLRRITVEEAAAIQAFPPGIQWQGAITSRYRQIGNAVPPTMAFHVAKALKASLCKTSAKQLEIKPSFDRQTTYEK